MFNKILSTVIWFVAVFFILFEIMYIVTKSNNMLTLAISAGIVYIVLTCIFVLKEMVEWLDTDTLNMSVSF